MLHALLELQDEWVSKENDYRHEYIYMFFSVCIADFLISRLADKC